MKLLISEEESEQVKLGSCTSFSFQLIRVVRDVADMFNFGVILGRTELSPNSAPFLTLKIMLTANSRSSGLGLESKDRRQHSAWAYHAEVLI